MENGVAGFVSPHGLGQTKGGVAHLSGAARDCAQCLSFIKVFSQHLVSFSLIMIKIIPWLHCHCEVYSSFCFVPLQQHLMQHFTQLTMRPMRAQRTQTSTKTTSRWWYWYHGISEKIGFRMSPPSIPFLQTYSIHHVALSTGFISLSVNNLEKTMKHYQLTKF